MPLIDVIRPERADRAAFVGGTDRVIADFDLALFVEIHLAAEIERHHLRAEADAEKRLVLLQRNGDPVDLALDEIVLVIGALRPAENHRAGMLCQGVRQGIAETRPADIEAQAALAQNISDAAGRRMFLVQNDQNRSGHRGGVIPTSMISLLPG